MRASLMVLALLAGCSTVPVTDSDAVPVPAERLLDRDVVAAGPERGTVIVKRDSGPMGVYCDVRVLVNAKPVALIRNGEKLLLQLPYGQHLLGAEAPVCAGRLTEQQVNVAVGKTNRFRIGYSGAGELALGPTSF
jgi:hypothetical protein